MKIIYSTSTLFLKEQSLIIIDDCTIPPATSTIFIHKKDLPKTIVGLYSESIDKNIPAKIYLLGIKDICSKIKQEIVDFAKKQNFLYNNITINNIEEHIIIRG